MPRHLDLGPAGPVEAGVVPALSLADVAESTWNRQPALISDASRGPRAAVSTFEAATRLPGARNRITRQG